MNIFIAGAYWLFLWVTAAPNTASALKQNYPEVPFIESLRAKFLAHLVGVTPDSKGLVAGLAIGERGAISDQLAEQMKALSLTHLVAVSGANLAIVTAAIFFLLAQIGLSRNWRFGLAFCSMFGYVILVGPESSVLRAATMATFVMAGLWIGRQVSPLRMLAWAVLLLLIVDPGLAVDFGFALSVFATSGLLVLATKIYEKLKTQLHPVLALGVGATFAAQLYTMPILLMLQPSIPVYSVLANLIVEVVVAPVTVLGISSVLAVAVFPPVAELLSFFASLGTWWIEFVAIELSQLPFLRIPFIQGPIGVGFMVAVVIGITLMVVSKGRSTKRLGAAISLFAIAVPCGWVTMDLLRFSNFAEGWQVLNCDVGQGDALLLQAGNQIALVDVGREDKPIDSCLKGLGVTEIDLLVLTHFDADHVGGIVGALDDRKVGRVLISGFEDDRPLVSLVEAALAAKGVQAERVYVGMSGSLGDGKWKVLSPSYDASEAEDSNDSSVVALFEFAEFNVLTTGDLGEVGQIRLLRALSGELSRASAKPLVLKVAHHGSADQSREFIELLDPEISLISVGKFNTYGHPTDRTLRILNSIGSKIFRTDNMGAIAISIEGDSLQISSAGKLSM